MTVHTDSLWPQVQAHPWKYRARTHQITGILWHSTRGGQWYDGVTELGAYMNWVKSPNNYNPGNPSLGIEPYAGIASVGIGPGKIVECVPDNYMPAWSSWASDETKLSVEVAQSNLGQPIEAETITECVRYARAMSAQYGFPLERVYPTSDWSWVGMAGHEDTVQGKLAGKTDPGVAFWEPFLAALANEGDDDMTAIEELNKLKIALYAGSERASQNWSDQQKLEYANSVIAAGGQSMMDLAASAIVLAKEALAASDSGTIDGSDTDISIDELKAVLVAAAEKAESFRP